VALLLVRAFNEATATAASRAGMYRGLAAVRQGADAWAPLFALADASRLRVFVHPGHEPAPDGSGADNPWNRRYGLDPQHLALMLNCGDLQHIARKEPSRRRLVSGSF
jgi:hypothetical protein